MASRLTLMAPVAAMLLASAASSAQQPPTVPQPAGQPLPSRLDTARLSQLVAQPARQEPRPDAPVAMAINWGQVAEDIQQQARTFQRPSSLALVNQTALPFVRPGNPEAAAISTTNLPVLIPGTAALGLDGNARVLLFPRPDFYTLSISGPGLTIEVFGTRLAHARAPDPLSTRRLNATDGDGYRVSATEYGRELSFNRYGAAYSITVECDRPEADPRCGNDAYVRNLADSLIIAAGTPDTGGQ